MHLIKLWLRSRSREFVRYSSPESFGMPVQSYGWNGHPVYYRPGSSDPDLIYKILLKPGRKGEYWVPEIIKPRVILDIGSNMGASAVYFAHRFPDAHIHAFEPVPENFSLLSRNTAPYKSITSYPVALGTRDGELRINASDDPRNYGGYSFGVTGVDAQSTATVEMRNCAAMLKEIGVNTVDLIKIDTEGHEPEIIRAMEEALLSKVQWIIGELHGGEGFDLLAYLSAWFDISVKKTLGKRLFMFNACNRSILDDVKRISGLLH